MATSRAVVAVCVLLGLASQAFVSAQWMGAQLQGGQPGLGGAWGGSPSPWGAGRFGQQQQQQDNTEYLTCTAANSNNDDMRITFSTGSRNDNPWGRFGMMGNNFANGRGLRLQAQIRSGQGSPLQGQFQLVVTQNSRSEEVCLSRALGDILTDSTPAWWGRRNQRARGMVGTPIRIMQGQTATSSESVDNLRFDELAGLGMALCPSHQITGTTCADTIPLCCKIGYDSQPATTPFTSLGQMFNGGFQNGGFNGNGNPLGGGFNQGMGGNFNPGMGGPMSQGGNPGLPGLNQGQDPMGQGMGGLNNAGGGNIGGLTFQNGLK